MLAMQILKTNACMNYLHRPPPTPWIDSPLWSAEPIYTIHSHPPSHCVVLNDEEFIAVTTSHSSKLLKYNINKREWTQIASLPYLWSSSKSITININKQILYIKGFGADKLSDDDKGDHRLLIFDLKTKKQTIKKNIPTSWSDPTLYCVGNGNLHLILGRDNDKHYVWSDDKSKFIEQYQFIDTTFNKGVGRNGHGFIYLKTKQQFLLFGGSDWYNSFDDIWRYTLKTTKWEKLKMRLPEKMSNVAHIVTNDEKYIIILNPWTEKAKYFTNDIYIWNLETMTIRRSQIVTRWKMESTALIISNYIHLLTNRDGDANHAKIDVNKLINCNIVASKM